MKKIVFVLLALVFLMFAVVAIVNAQTAGSSVQLAWDANTEPELTGYKLYRGNTSRQYSANVELGLVTTYTFTNLPDGTYYFAATARAGTLESDYSNEVSWIVDTTAPVISSFGGTRVAGSSVITINSFTATDANGVTGYLITESATKPIATATGWTTTAPTSYTVTNQSNTIYAWAKDVKGNVSNSASLKIILPPTNLKVR